MPGVQCNWFNFGLVDQVRRLKKRPACGAVAFPAECSRSLLDAAVACWNAITICWMQPQLAGCSHSLLDAVAACGMQL